MTDIERRQALVDSVERHEQELALALNDFKEAVRRPFAMVDEVGDRIAGRPLPWLLSSMLIGLWLGTRASSNGYDQ